MGGGDVTAKPLSEQLQQVKKDAQHFIENIDAHLEKIRTFLCCLYLLCFFSLLEAN
jgi:hypothetical protein